MLALPAHLKVFVCKEPTDLRNGFEGLCAKAEVPLPQQLFSGMYFAFFNRSADQVKILYWEERGCAIWTKRLETGRFATSIAKEQMTRRAFFVILEGLQVVKKSSLSAYHQSSYGS